MIKQFLIFLMVSVLLNSYAQVDLKFIEHLSANKLKMEQWTYLNAASLSDDSLSFLKSKFHLQYGDDGAFFENFDQCQTLFLADKNAVQFASQHFLALENQWSSRWFSNLPRNTNSLTGLPFAYDAAYHPNEVDFTLLPSSLQGDFLRLQKSDRKHPLLAATFSAIIPGSGKLYIGSSRSFLLTFVSLSILGLQTWESYARFGIKHPLTIINGGLFSMYYVTNIFGSFRETKTKKINRRKQFLLNASIYYSSTAPSRLY